jgi:hypothetical protein
MKFKSDTEPLGTVLNNPDNVSFEVANNSTRRRGLRTRKEEPYEIPPLNSEGLEDNDLKALLHDRGGIVTILNDASITEEGNTEDGTVYVERFY